jgi:hypothetical protein
VCKCKFDSSKSLCILKSPSNRTGKRCGIFAFETRGAVKMYYLSPQCISSMCLGLQVVARGRPPMPLRSMFTILLRVVLTPFARRVAITDDGPYSRRFARCRCLCSLHTRLHRSEQQHTAAVIDRLLDKSVSFCILCSRLWDGEDLTAAITRDMNAGRGGFKSWLVHGFKNLFSR